MRYSDEVGATIGRPLLFYGILLIFPVKGGRLSMPN